MNARRVRGERAGRLVILWRCGVCENDHESKAAGRDCCWYAPELDY